MHSKLQTAKLQTN